ncbi:unnamed protein product, partial [Prorocentrum cordatum]
PAPPAGGGPARLWRAAPAAAAAAGAAAPGARARAGLAQGGRRRVEQPAPGTGADKLERFLSKAGALSRTQARTRVQQGDVQVNGRQVLDPWHMVRPGVDVVEVAGLGAVQLPDWEEVPPTVVLFNKPAGVMVTLNESDPWLRDKHLPLNHALPQPWRDLLAPHVPALRPVGRLDLASVGLLLLTDSSHLAATLTTPGNCDKEYLLRVSPAPTETGLRQLREGVHINDGNASRGKTQACDVAVVESSADGAVLRFRISEGRNRQLRRMCSAVGLKVQWLLRTRVGPVKLGSLPLGGAREATAEEQSALLRVA